MKNNNKKLSQEEELELIRRAELEESLLDEKFKQTII